MKNIIKKNSVILGALVALLFTLGIAFTNDQSVLTTNANPIEELSNKKIEWGIKRAKNHEQPDLGSTNKNLIDKYNGMAMGNSDSKKVYLTFDMGYEAGYTEKILEVLKKNNVPATFFITAHYVNSQPELVQKMIDEGHIIGNQLPPSQMYQI